MTRYTPSKTEIKISTHKIAETISKTIKSWKYQSIPEAKTLLQKPFTATQPVTSLKI
jgi:hypothetical protein